MFSVKHSLSSTGDTTLSSHILQATTLCPSRLYLSITFHCCWLDTNTELAKYCSLTTGASRDGVGYNTQTQTRKGPLQLPLMYHTLALSAEARVWESLTDSANRMDHQGVWCRDMRQSLQLHGQHRRGKQNKRNQRRRQTET